MIYAIIGARILLGLVFTVFGVNGFANFLPMPEMNEQAGQFLGVMAGSGYLYVIKAIEIIGGLLLLIGKFKPLGLVLLGPVVVNIFLFHVFLDAKGMIMAVVLLALEIFLVWAHREQFAGVFAAD